MGFKVVRDSLSGLERVYIPSRVHDNKYLGEDYVSQLRASGSKELVKAWLEGDWSVIEGAFFDCWETSKHVIRPFEIPGDWLRFRSCDWGSAKPFSVGWWAIAQDDYSLPDSERGASGDGLAVIPRGAMVRYREWYGKSAPNTGLKLTAEEVANGILERTPKTEKITYGVIDPAAFAVDGGPSIAERMGKIGIHFGRADNKRVAQMGALGGWDQMRARMKGDGDGHPLIYTFSTCADSIRTIPALQHDRDKPEDLDTDGEDHAADEWRYACMSRPWVPNNKQRTVSQPLLMAQPDGTVRSTLTIQQLIDRQKKRRK